MSEDTFYVRNNRPNSVRIKFKGIVLPLLQRRGTREDTLSLPIEAKRDHVIARFIRQGVLEEISFDVFQKLGEREGPSFSTLEERGRTEPKTKGEAKGILAGDPDSFTMPMSSEEESRKPNIIPEEYLSSRNEASKKVRVPTINFEYAVEPTTLASAEREIELARSAPKAKTRKAEPASNAELTRQIAELQRMVLALAQETKVTVPPAPELVPVEPEVIGVHETAPHPMGEVRETIQADDLSEFGGVN